MKHKHHIIPKHIGGSNDPSNLIELTIAEHADAHRILYEQYGRIEDKCAWLGLSGLMGKEEILSELAKRPHSLETRLKISNSNMGKKRPYVTAALTGVPRSEETKKKIAKSKKGKPRFDMIGNSYAKAPNGRPKSEEHKKSVTSALNTQEVKDKMKNAWLSKPMVTCPHCNLSGKGPNMNRYHFNNCKGKNNG
jgi:hypothetical protein